MTHQQILDSAFGADAWTSVQTEHIATRAAELGDTLMERLCDEVSAGETDAAVLIDVVRADRSYSDWLARGIELGWARRTA